MKTLVLALLAVAGLAGCVVVPAEPAAFIGMPRVYVTPLPLVVVPGRPSYYGYGGGYGRGYGAPRYRPYY
jgi:hypothetical protein